MLLIHTKPLELNWIQARGGTCSEPLPLYGLSTDGVCARGTIPLHCRDDPWISREKSVPISSTREQVLDIFFIKRLLIQAARHGHTSHSGWPSGCLHSPHIQISREEKCNCCNWLNVSSSWSIDHSDMRAHEWFCHLPRKPFNVDEMLQFHSFSEIDTQSKQPLITTSPWAFVLFIGTPNEPSLHSLYMHMYPLKADPTKSSPSLRIVLPVHHPLRLWIFRPLLLFWIPPISCRLISLSPSGGDKRQSFERKPPSMMY